MTLGKAQKTCEEKYAEEREASLRAYRSNVGNRNPEAMMRQFFAPCAATDEVGLAERTWDALFCGQVCDPTNRRGTCEQDCGCECEECKTQCPDDGCHDHIIGIAYADLVEAYYRVMSMARLPMARLETAKHGDVLVFDETAIPDNRVCDPCAENGTTRGAWVPSQDPGAI